MNRQSLVGCAFLFLGFGAWGFNPFYFKAVQEIPALEILAHRVLWAVPMLAVIVWMAGGWPHVRKACKDRRTLAILFLTTALLSFNWLVFIWSVFDAKILEASLGYYITPLSNLLLGFLILRERLTRWQFFAVVLAAAGVINLIWSVGVVPWLGLSLAATFSVYGLLRKTAAVPSVEGLLIETTIMLPPALAFTIWLALEGQSSFASIDLTTDLLLIAAGPVTAIPLLWFTSGARRVRLSTVAMFQFIAPTCHFILAVFVFGEAFDQARLITFALVWLGVGIFSWDSLRRSLTQRSSA